MNQRDMIKFKDEYLARLADINPSGLAAQLAYLFLLSLFPFLIFSITLLGYTSIKADDVINLVKRSVPFETASIIADNVRSVLAGRKTGLLSFGAIAAIWSASSALNSIINVLDKSYKVTECRSFLRSRAVAIALDIHDDSRHSGVASPSCVRRENRTYHLFIYGVIVGISHALEHCQVGPQLLHHDRGACRHLLLCPQ